MKVYPDLIEAMENHGAWGEFPVDFTKGPLELSTLDRLRDGEQIYVATRALTLSSRDDVDSAIADGTLKPCPS